MKLYVMRHGTTVWNEKGITQGRTNNRLSKNGKLLTEKVAKELQDVDFDGIITSPLMRTVQTANIINKYHKVKILKDDNLIEIDQGDFTGRSKNSLSKKEETLKNKRAKSAGMESYEECFKRVKTFLNTIKQKYNFESVLIVTHNCVATFIEDILTNKKVNFNSNIFLRDFKNAEVRKFVI
ncbi:MAG: histidine phosphatase family protein [Christensenellales bacterium]